jgi:uncharacterized protein with FMN-binding domain
MTSSLPRWFATGLSTAAAGALLAGCGGSDDASSTTATAADAAATTTAQAAGGASEGSSSTGTYADGTYEAEGSYQSPGGNEKVKVSLTLKGDTVSAVKVTPESENPNGKKYQGQFAGGISDVVVGKKIDALQVSKVAGSSLTSGGFNQAVEKIEADAKAQA